jgi:hypothetical protein
MGWTDLAISRQRDLDRPARGEIFAWCISTRHAMAKIKQVARFSGNTAFYRVVHAGFKRAIDAAAIVLRMIAKG